ncbi:MAG: hypothetical protein WCP85_28510, partial [Mariniphaga sp.]
TNSYYYYDGTSWKLAASIPTGTTLPLTATIGDPYFKTDNNTLYIYTSGGWTVAGLSNILANGSFFVGNASNIATATTKTNIPLSGFGDPTTSVSMGTQKLTNVATPTADPDAANKAYVDSKSSTTPTGPTLPAVVGAAGNTFFNTTDKVLYISDGTKWLPVATDGSTPSGPTFPPLPSPGDVFYNTATNNLYYYDGTSWKVASSIPTGTTLPVAGTPGDPFFKSDTNTLYVYSNGLWNVAGLSNILANGSFFVGNASNIATPTTKATIPLSGFGVPTTDVSMGSLKLTNLASPTANSDAANKAYVDLKTATTPSGPTNPPAAGANVGDVFYNTATNSFYYFDGTNWKLISNVPSGPTLPPTGNAGDTFYNTSNNTLYVSNGTTWNSTKVQADWAQNTPTADDYIKNKPASLVTSVSVVTANGVSGTVATPTSTPAITLTLGNITPTSVAAVGTVTGSNISGTNTGDVTIGTANGLSLSGQQLNLATSTATTSGAMSATDKAKLDALATTPATSGNIMIANGTTWESKPVSGDITITNAGVATIGNNKVTDAKLDKPNIPISGFGAATDNVAMGNKLITNLANPVAATDAANKQYVDNQLNLNALFNGQRPVTRTGLTGISGINFNTTTLVDFLNKVFFPTRSPYLNFFRYNNVATAGMVSFQTVDPVTQVTLDNLGTVTVPYATWSDPLLPFFIFKYDIAQQDPIAISKVELYNGSDATPLFTNVDGALVGAFDKVPKSSSYTSLKLKITDASSNEVSLTLNTVFVAPLGVQIGNVRISNSNGGVALTTSEGAGTAASPWLIQRTGADFNYFLNWEMTKNNDANVTNINFTGPPTLGNLAGANLSQSSISPVTLPNSDAATVYHLGVSAKGNVASVFSPIGYSAYYQLRDKTYCGYIPAASAANPQESDILGLQLSSLMTSQYFSSLPNGTSPLASESGVDLTNNLGVSGYFTWAVPTYVKATSAAPAFIKYPSTFAFGSWAPYSEGSDMKTFLVKTTGANASWYWVCVFNPPTAPGAKTRAILQN